jgi:murein DD-endopeptidase MepM/ murein hydrolase activator NlpD
VLVIISLAVGYATITQGGFPGKSRAFAAPATSLAMPGSGSSVQRADLSVVRPPTINRTLRADQPVSTKQREEADQFTALMATPTVAPSTEQEDAVVRAAAVAPPPDLPPYQVYQVQEGDTVSAIADRFGITSEYIIANNAEIHDSDLLTLGQSIIIPAGNGILHEVRYGETLSDIAARYDVEVDVISAFGSNGISSPDDITETQLVYVPGGTLPVAVVPEPEAVPLPLPDAAGGETDDSESDDGPATSPSGGIVSGGPSSSEGLIWPVVGPISSYYGGGHPLGIDIDGFNLGGAAIGAATSGTVVFAGGNACCSYGLYVVVVSPGGIETLYAHLSSISVSQGQSVSQGEQLGIIGDTGYSTGVHLHFEVIDNGVRVNPLSYLP